MTIGGWLEIGQRELSRAGIVSARLDSLILLEYVMGKDRAWLLAHPEAEVAPKWVKPLSALLAQRKRQVPLAQLIKQQAFYGLGFEVNADVLAPRPESEPIVEQAALLAPHRGRLLDVGTGSGALAIAIAKHRPDLEIVATEISDAALRVARRNRRRHRVSVAFRQSDLFSHISGKFHLVVANLPYIAQPSSLTTGAQHEPKAALIGGGSDGLDTYRQFFRQLPAYLLPGAYVICESDPWQQADLAQLAAATGLRVGRQDYFISCFQATGAPLPASP